MCLRLSAGNISLLGQILIVACVCSDKQNDINTEDRKANDTATASTGLRLILVRHAEAYRNLPGRQSVPDSMLDTLTPRGIKQADAVGKALKESGVQVATVLTAPTGRAGQTAALLIKALGAGPRAAAPDVPGNSRSTAIREGVVGPGDRWMKPSLLQQCVGLAVFVLICFAAAGLGGFVTASAIPNW